MIKKLHAVCGLLVATLAACSVPAMAQVYNDWRLMEIRREFSDPGGIQSGVVRIDSVRAHALGGSVRMTSLSDNPAPGCTGAVQRHQFIWTFDRSVDSVWGRVGDTVITAYLRVEGDEGGMCIDLNPSMTMQVSARETSEVFMRNMGGEISWHFRENPPWIVNPPPPKLYINRNDRRAAGFEIVIPIPRAGVSGGLFLYIEYLYSAHSIVPVREPAEDSPPHRFGLLQNYPNPFNPSTTIGYALPKRSHVTLTVFNALGEKVADLVNGELGAGYHEARFDASDLASCVYLYRLQAGDFVQTRKLILLK